MLEWYRTQCDYHALMEECERASDPQDDIAEARSEAEESWLEDAKGSKTLSKKKWLDALFELGEFVYSFEHASCMIFLAC